MAVCQSSTQMAFEEQMEGVASGKLINCERRSHLFHRGGGDEWQAARSASRWVARDGFHDISAFLLSEKSRAATGRILALQPADRIRLLADSQLCCCVIRGCRHSFAWD